MNDTQAIPDFLWQVLDFLPVLGREEHRLDARSEGSDQFLLYSSNGCDLAPQTQLTLRRDTLR